jgi:hypothetical protein
MRITKLTADAASVLAVETLGVDPESVDLGSVEGIAASLRRAASFLCPTSPDRLVDAILGACRPLTAGGITREDVADVLEQLIASGDLLELRRELGRSTRMLYLAPPSYIERQPGSFLIMGVRPFGLSIIQSDLAGTIECEGHTRLISLGPVDGPTQLQQLGLNGLKKNHWVSSPAVESPGELIDRYRVRLDVAREAGQIDGLVILDPTSSIRYYRGRWRTPTATDSGDFVARRPQAYGADLWYLVRLQAGAAQRLLELPLDNAVVPGRDEAWRYQAAVDAARGTPQRFRARLGGPPDGTIALDFFMPLPAFAERYVQLVGLALGRARGALFSFRVSIDAGRDVAAFLASMLWMSQEEVGSGV